MSLLLIDIDYFKQINDQFGHGIGDETLVKVTEVIAENLRETDKFCRVGGEEFAIIMPMTNIESALLLAERLREVVASLTTNVVPIKTTISLGLTEFKQWDTFNSIFKRADMALYEAKENGRNRVEVINDGGEKIR